MGLLFVFFMGFQEISRNIPKLAKESIVMMITLPILFEQVENKIYPIFYWSIFKLQFKKKKAI